MPPWHVVYQQMQRWLKWGCFEILVEDVRSLVREWAGYDGAKHRKRSKVHIAVDTLGHLLALTVTPASEGDREQVAALAEQVQQVTGNSVQLAHIDQGYTRPNAAQAAEQHGLHLEVVKHPMAKRGFVLPGAEWWNEASPGPLDSAASPKTTNGSTRRSKDSTCSPSQLSCCGI